MTNTEAEGDIGAFFEPRTGPKQYPNGAEAITQAKELTPYDHFLMKHIARVRMWMEDHPEGRKFKPLPIIFIDGEYHWENRAERRRK